MGDRTALQVYVYGCPKRYQARVRRILTEEYLLEVDWGMGGDGGALALGEPYTDDQAECGCAREVAAALIAAAPRCRFLLWEDPASEWLGELRAYTPRLGEFAGECDVNGTVVLNYDQITHVVRAAAADLGGSGRLVSLGQAVELILAALRGQMAGPWLADWGRRDRGGGRA